MTMYAPRTLHAVAGYVVAPHEGCPTEYFREGDPVVVDTLGWYYWPDDGKTFDAANRALSQYTAWASNADTPDDCGGRIGAMLAALTVPEDVRRTIEQEADDAKAGELLNDWVDTIEWEDNWISPHVTIVKMTTAFKENRERIIARRAVKKGV